MKKKIKISKGDRKVWVIAQFEDIADMELYIYDLVTGETIITAECYKRPKESDLRLIVKAVNSHEKNLKLIDELVEALEAAQEEIYEFINLQNATGWTSGKERGIVESNRIYNLCVEALAKAKGKEG